jgi:hypothetical protein
MKLLFSAFLLPILGACGSHIEGENPNENSSLSQNLTEGDTTKEDSADTFDIESIHSLAEISERILPRHLQSYSADQIAVFSDWDDVVVTKKTGIEALNESDCTLRSITAIRNLGIDFLIITARYEGIYDPAQGKEYVQSVQRMTAILTDGQAPLISNHHFKSNEDFAFTVFRSKHIRGNSSFGKYFAQNGIIFGGGGGSFHDPTTDWGKGEALALALDSQSFRSNPPKLIVVVDDKLHHLKNVKRAFEKRKEVVVLLQFRVREE